MRPRLFTAVVCSLLGLLGAAGAARADTQTSSNWSGYAVHGDGAHFRQASGEWRIPALNCSSGSMAYSALWVGLGGFSSSSPALEQTGTEGDCNGREPVYSAWYELVPSPSHTLSMTVRPGDLMRAQVSVNGRQVTLTLADLTRHHTFSRTFTPAAIDATSAEWILEAPGACSGSRCVTLPLADFGRAAFDQAHVVTAHGRPGAITSAHWQTTRITLAGGGRRFTDIAPGGSSGGASPGSLTASGSAFSLSYVSTAAGQPSPFARDVVSADRLVH